MRLLDDGCLNWVIFILLLRFGFMRLFRVEGRMAHWLMVLVVFQILLCYLLQFMVRILLPLILELTIVCWRYSHHLELAIISLHLWLISIISILLIFFTSLPLFFQRSLISFQDHLLSFWLMAVQGTKIILPWRSFLLLSFIFPLISG